MASIKFSGSKITEHFSTKEYAINQTGTVKLTAEAIMHAQCLEEFRKWLGREMSVHAWYRTAAYNKSVGGVAKSLHLSGCATDWHTTVTIDKDRFIKYAKKWKEICEAHGIVGEAGLYSWGVHFGSGVSYSKNFYHWDSRSGKQINMPFKELM